MAEIFTDEGIDLMHGVFPKNGTNFANLYLGLWTGLTPSTVPARTATGGAAPSGWTEVTGTGYARIVMPSTDWQAPATNGNGRKITGLQKTFTGGAGGWTVANGYFIATLSASGAADKILCFANFDSGLGRTLAQNDTLKVTPSMQFDG